MALLLSNRDSTAGDVAPADPARRRRRWSLRTYLVGLVVAVLATGFGTVAYERRAATDDARGAAGRSAQFGATLAARQIGADIGLARTTVGTTAASPGIGGVFAAPAGCTLNFSGVGAFRAGHLDIVATDGAVACTSLRRGSAGYAGAPWLAAAMAGPTMAGPVDDARTGKSVLLTSAPIPGLGAVVAFLDLEALGPGLAARFGGPSQLEFVVTSPDTHVALTRSIDAARWSGADLTATSFARTSTQVDHADLDGTPRIYGHAEVDGVGWRVFAGADRSAALADAHGLSQRILLLTIGRFLAFLVIAWVIARLIARPIRRLSEEVRSATSWKGPASVAVDGPAEVARLAEDVNTLIAAGERALVATARLAAIVESSDDAIIGESLDGTITSWNSGAERMYGYAADEIVGRNVAVLAPADRAEEVGTALASVARGEHVEPYETQRLHKDGRTIDVSLTISPIRDGMGAVVGASATARDITERNRSEAERRSLEERLNQSQRLESLGQLAGGIAHDFNNLLGVIINFATFVAEDTADNPAVQADIAEIQAAAERGARLTRQLLLVGRREAIEAQDIDLNAVVTDVHSLLSRSIGEHIEVNMVLAAEPAVVRVDRGQMEQVVLNLAVNARDAMPSGGTLTIETRRTDLDEEYCRVHPEVSPGAFVELVFSDTGTGIAPEVVSRIFEPFFTTKPRGEGTGLGLATLYGIVVAAGGSVTVYSELGIGTTFRAFFPEVHAADHVEAPEPTDARSSGGGETVLVVEDEPAMLDVTCRILRRNGYTVLEAATWEQAVAVAEEHDFDLLLTDSVIPEMPGRDLAELLRGRRPGIAVLFMSGYSQGVLGPQRVLEPGAALIEKPFNESQLLDEVRSVLDAAPSDPT
jgi:PAS domain S-box-containing protein